MSVLLIAGSPSERSRTAAFLDAAGQRLETRGVLKFFLDLLQQDGFKGKTVLPLAANGSPILPGT